jgi:hypothetical protein
MALIFMDGFDAGDMSAKWNINASTTSSTSTRFGTGRAMGIGTGGTRYATKYFTPTSELFVGFAGTGLWVGFNNIPFMYLYSDGGLTQQIILATNSNGSISIRRGGTTLATSSGGALTASWDYIEVHAIVDATAGLVDVHVNGSSVVSFSGNTKNGGTSNNIDGIMFNNNGSLGSGAIDDLYLLDATGPAPYNTFLGDVRIYTMVPDGAGSSTQMTPSSGANYTTVDELPYSATDYVSASIGQQDLYTASNIPSNPGSIYGVQANIVAKKTDAGTISGNTVIKSGATVTKGTARALNSSDTVFSDIHQTNPDTGTAWSESALNAIEIGTEAS